MAEAEGIGRIDYANATLTTSWIEKRKRYRAYLAYKVQVGLRETGTDAEGRPTYEPEYKWKSKSSLLPAECDTETKAKKAAKAWRKGLEAEQSKAIAQAEAEREERERAEEERTRREADASRPKVYASVLAYVDEYEADHRDRSRTIDDMRSLAKHFERFKDVALADLRSDDLVQWARDEKEQFAPLTVRKAFSLLSRVYRRACADARERGEEMNDPTASEKIVLPPKRVLRAKNALDADGVRDLAALLRTKQQVPVIVAARLALQLGLRQQEVCALTWGDVDLKKGILHVRHAIARNNHGASVSKTKTEASRRDVILTEEAARILKARRSKIWEDSRPLGLSSAQFDALYVLGDASGAFVDPNRISRQWGVFASIEGIYGSGVDSDGKPQLLRFHDIRHSVVTVALEATKDVEAVAATAGHAQASTTLDTYGQATTSGMEKVAEAMERATAPLPGELLGFHEAAGA